MTNYLHDCLKLHGEVAERRYGRVVDPCELERHVAKLLAEGCELWDVIRAIYSHEAFPVGRFGPLPDDIEAQLKEGDWHRQCQTLPKHQRVGRLIEIFSQIEPASMVLRFICPTTYGIMSAPVAAILGIRPRRSVTETYIRYLKVLQEVAAQRGFTRIADVEMALWALQVGVLEDKLLPPQQRDALEPSYRRDAWLRQLQTRNLVAHLLSQDKLDIAESLLTTDVKLAGQIAGIEFEQLVGERFGPPGDEGLNELIVRAGGPDTSRLHRARRTRNQAIHQPRGLRRTDVECLISTARWVKSLPRRSRQK